MTHLVPVIRPVLGTPFRRDSLYRRAGAMPSFHIAPASRQTAADLITGNVLGTYNSATPAMAVGPDGLLFQPAANAPVIEYDPVTLACLGARVWGVVQNLALRSEQFENASWTKFNTSVTQNTANSPNNTVTADSLIESTVSGTHVLFQDSAVLPSVQCTQSVFVKANNRNRIQIRISDTSVNYVGAFFDLSSGSLLSVENIGTGSGAVGSIKSYPNGWFRIAITGTPSTSGAAVRQHISILNNNGDLVYTGDGTSGVYLWGAQLNTGGLAPYVPTTTTSASSTAEAWSITGADAARIINTTEGTLYADAMVPNSTTGLSPRIIALSDGTNNNRVNISWSTDSVGGFIVANSGTVTTQIYPSVSTATRRAAAAYAVNDFAVSYNGQTPETATSGAVPSVNQINIGNTITGNLLNGYIRELAIFRSRRPNSNLQAMPL